MYSFIHSSSLQVKVQTQSPDEDHELQQDAAGKAPEEI